MSGSAATGMWSRADVRRRWRSLVLLGVIAGLTMGVALATFDGANRTSSALGRFRQAGNASDAVVFPSQVGLPDGDWDALGRRPEVAQLARWGLVFGEIDGDFNVMFAAMDGTWLDEIDRPTVVEGRMFDPTVPDEIVLSDDANSYGGPTYRVGDVIPFQLYAPDALSETPVAGPLVEMKIVGFVRTPLSAVFTGGVYVSPAFIDAHGQEAYIAVNAVVRLRNGQDDIADLRRSVTEDIGDAVPVLDLNATARRVTATTDVEQTMLVLLAAIVALAGVVFVGQALSRSAAAIAEDAPALRAIGMTRGQLVGAALVPHLLAAMTALAVTVISATVLSARFPVGLAGRIDPDRGVQLDPQLAAGGAVLAAVVVVAAVAAASWRAVGRSIRGGHRPRPPRSLVPPTRPLTLWLGARMALDVGRGSRRATTRPALLGAVAAVAGIVAIGAVDRGLDDAVANPHVAGVTWDATVHPSSSGEGVIAPDLIGTVRDAPNVADVATVGRMLTEIETVGVPMYTIVDEGSTTPIELVTMSGRAPLRVGEVQLGPATADHLDVDVGDEVTLADGSTARVVGLGLFPTDVHAQFDEGALAVPDQWFRLADRDPSSALFLAVRFAAGTDVDASFETLSAQLPDDVEEALLAEVPAELSNLENVRTLPIWLAVFLSVLGAVAVGHALFSSVRQRRMDFAILRALGVTPGGSRLVLTGQGVAVAVVGLLAGVPIGLIAGRNGWRALTERVPLLFRSPIDPVDIAIVVPLVLLAALLLAVVPGWRAATVASAEVLRTE